MKKLSILLFIAASISACVPVQTWKPASELTQQDRDEADCQLASYEARNDLFPNNPLLNAQARANSFALCMKSKGYVPLTQN